MSLTERLAALPARGFALRYVTLFAGESFSKLCVLVAFAYLARVLDPARYGVVETALSVTVFFVLGVESGMGAYGARVVAASPEALPRLLPRIMVLRAYLGVPAVIALAAFALMSTAAPARVIAVSGLSVLLTPWLTQWVFQGLRQMQWVAAGSMLRNFVFAGAILVLVRSDTDLRIVVAAEVLGVAALAAFNSVMLFGRLRIVPEWRGAASDARALFREVWPLGLSDFTWAALWYSPVIVLGWLGRDHAEQVAWVAAPTRIVLALHTFVWLYFFNLLPNLAAELTRGLDAWRDLVRRSMAVAMWPAGFIAVAGTVGAPLLVPAIFGPRYVAAVLPFQLVVWMIPVAWFSGHYRFTLIAAGRQHYEFATLAVGAVTTVVTSLALAPSMGSAGPAAALVLGGVVNAVLAMIATRRVVGEVPLAGGAVAAAVVAVVCIVLGLAVSRANGPVAGTVVACGIFGTIGAWQAAKLARTLRLGLAG